jgi:hypothetical protein
MFADGDLQMFAIGNASNKIAIFAGLVACADVFFPA